MSPAVSAFVILVVVPLLAYGLVSALEDAAPVVERACRRAWHHPLTQDAWAFAVIWGQDFTEDVRRARLWTVTRLRNLQPSGKEDDAKDN